MVIRLFKKSSLEPEDMGNYSTVFNLPFLEKVLRCAVALKLQEFLNDTDCLDPFESGSGPEFEMEIVFVCLFVY